MAALTTDVTLVRTMHAWVHGLHALRTAEATLASIGARCFEWVLLDGVIPCVASVEADIPTGLVVVPSWMLRQLRSRGRAGLSRANTPSSALAATRVALVAIDTEPHGGSAEFDDDFGDAMFAESAENDETPVDTATEEPFDGATLAAIRRQLLGIPLSSPHTLCAVQQLHGVRILRAAQPPRAAATAADGATSANAAHPAELAPACCIARETTLDVVLSDPHPGGEVYQPTLNPPPPPPSVPASSSSAPSEPAPPPHGAEVQSLIRSHALSLLQVTAACGDGDTRSGRSTGVVDGALAKAAGRGGHALLCGAPCSGKWYALCGLVEQLRRDHRVAVFTLSCADLLELAETAAPYLDSRLATAFGKARRRRPAVCSAPSSVARGGRPRAGTDSHGVATHGTAPMFAATGASARGPQAACAGLTRVW